MSLWLAWNSLVDQPGFILTVKLRPLSPDHYSGSILNAPDHIKGLGVRNTTTLCLHIQSH